MSTNIEQELAGKVVVITGSGRGIGKEMAISAAAHGARLALVEVIKENLDSTVKEIAATGAEVRGYHTDLGNEAQVIENFKMIEKDFGKIDCLVNNAMVHEAEDLAKTSLESWNRSLQITLTGSFLTIRAVLPGMMQRKAGNIINIGTVNAKTMVGSDSYSVAKAGLHALTRTVAVRYGGNGIRCNKGKKSIRTGTMFDNSQRSTTTILQLVWHFVHCLSEKQCVQYTNISAKNNTTVVKWYMPFAEIRAHNGFGNLKIHRS
jgi:NAD(P)-dependent dehydrogenase (short-subunit alcohol dehydrogenase family)